MAADAVLAIVADMEEIRSVACLSLGVRWLRRLIGRPADMCPAPRCDWLGARGLSGAARDSRAVDLVVRLAPPLSTVYVINANLSLISRRA